MLNYKKKNGTYRIYSKKTGKVIMEKNYRNGDLNGEFNYFWDNGQLHVTGFFNNKRRAGTWINYDINGNIILKENY
tara:strand:+ start:73 stop:300 length:228 start_codon:yes stop_codon:yes gene_type:complete